VRGWGRGRSSFRAQALVAAALGAGFAGCGGEPAGKGSASLAETAPPPAEAEPRKVPIQVAYDQPTILSLAAGECHVLELELEADRYVELQIEQRGIDVMTNVTPPGGGEVLRFDSPTSDSGRELAAFVTEHAGLHGLEICPFPFTTAAPVYQIRLSRPRAPGESNRALARGLLRYAEGEAREEADPDAATAAFEEALAAFELAGAQSQQGWTYTWLGRLAGRRGDLAQAETFHSAGAEIHRRLGEARQEAYALTFLGKAVSARLRREEAREIHRRSLRLAEAVGDDWLVLNALENLGITHEFLGETLPAIEVQRRRRTLAAEMGAIRDEWDALRRIGSVLLAAGDDRRAEETFEQALSFARRHRLAAGITTSLQDLGYVHLQREEAPEALAYFEEALARKGPRSDEELAQILNSLGRSHRRLDDREKALEMYARALTALPPEGARARLIEGMILINLASLHILEGDFDAAEEPSERALAIHRAAGESFVTMGALKCLAEVRAAQGALAEAAALLDELLDHVEGRRRRSAIHRLRAAYLEDKHFYYEFYVEVLLRLDERHPGQGYAARAFEVGERARARLLLDEIAGTESDILASADPMAVNRKEELELQMSKLEESLLELGEDEQEALLAIRRRLRDLESEHAFTLARIFAEYPGWSAILESEPAPFETVRRALLADGETQLVSFLLGEDQGFAWIADRDSLRVVTLPGSERLDPLARAAADRLRKSDQAHLRIQAELTAEALSRELLAPVVPHLTARKLLLVKDGALHYVPFAALPLPAGGEGPAGPELLIDRFELVELPSASAAVALRRRGIRAASGLEELALLGDPVFRADDERLRGLERPATPREASAAPGGTDRARATRGLGLGELRRLEGTLEEVRRISALVPPDRRLVALGFEANQDLVLGGRLGRYRVLHLAGHGLAHPDLTALVLSLYDERGRSVDGIVSPYELYGTRLSAELVVLSACSTGLGDEVRGEGLLGLSRGFLYAGASQVLASLWDVDDRATAELMERFYIALLRDGDTPARALRTAQLSLRSEPRWSAPHHWAGFVLQGDGR